MITIHERDAADFSGNGLGTLNPISCIVTETLNGNYEVVLTHPIDEAGKFTRIQEERIIRVPVPAGKTPRVNMGSAQTATMIYRVQTGSGERLHLRAAASLNAKIIGKYKVGTEVVVIDNTTSSQWSEVTTPDGKHGWMWTEYLEYVRTETSGMAAEEGIKEAATLRDQPFRIYKVVPTLTSITAYARHIFYDLMDNMVSSYKPGDSTTGAAAFIGLAGATEDEHGFTFYSDIDSTAEGVEITDKNPAEAILDDGGLIENYGGELARDWWDVYLAKRVGEETSIHIREGKNLLGIKYSVDTTNVVTRVIPKGEDEDGNPLYLDGRYRENEAEDKPVYVNNKYGIIEVKEAKVKTKGDEKRTEAECIELMEKAAKEAFEAGCDLPDVTLQVDFIDCAETEEYRQYRNLQGIHMGDTVKVIAKRVGVEVAMRMTQYSYNCLTRKYTKMTLGTIDATIEGNMINPRSIGSGTIKGSMIKLGSVGTGAIADGAVNSLKIALAAIGYAHIGQAAIDQLAVNAVTAIRAEIRELVAGNITTDRLYADLATIAAAQITAANIEKANIQWAEIKNLSAEIAKVVEAEIGSATIGTAQIENLEALVAELAKAEINTANIGQANIDWAAINSLTAVIADIANAELGTADIDYARIKDLVTDTAIITMGVGGKLYIERLAVTEANMVQLTVGELMLKDVNGNFVRLTVNADGEVVTEIVQVEGGNVADSTISGGKLIENTITARELNVAQIFADEALVRAIKAANIDVADLFASNATVNELDNYILRTQTIEAIEGQLDVWASKKIRLAVESVRVGSTNLLRQSKALPVGATADDWRISRTDIGKTYAGADGFYRAQLSASDLTADAWAGVYTPVTKLPKGWKGREITLSAWVYSDSWAGMDAGGSAPAVWGLCLSQGGATRLNYGSKGLIKAGTAELAEGVSSDVELENGKWVRVSMTWTLNEDELNSGTGDFDANTHAFIQFFLRRNGTYILYAPKLEFGNRATEWSPAPEDTEEEISELSAELVVQAGRIEANTSAIETVQEQADANADDLSAVTTRVTTAEQSISALDGKIAAKVEKTEFDALGEEVSRQGTLIEQTAEDVLIQAGRTVGGTNYLRDSARSVSNSTYNIANYYFSDNLKPKAGEMMTVRIWGSLGEGKTGFGVWNTNGYNTLGSLTDNGDGTYSAAFEWKLVGNVPEYAVTEQSQTHLQVYALPKDVTGVVSTITKIKLEKGDYATDWTPHPEDPSTGLNTGESSAVRVKITPEYFNVDVPGEDGDFTLNEAGGRLPVLNADVVNAPNVTPRYDGPGALYVDPAATSAQIEAGNYYRSLADACAALSCKWVGRVVTINLAAGMTEYGTATLHGVSGGYRIRIAGSSSNPARVVGKLNLYYSSSPINVEYLKIDTSSVGIDVDGCQIVNVTGCTIVGPGTDVSGTRGIRARYGSTVYIGSTAVYDCERSLFAEMCGSIGAYTCKGNCRVGANRGSLFLSDTMPCDSTTWTAWTWAGQVITQSVTVDQGDKPTAEAAPTTATFNYLYSDSYRGGWSYFTDADARQGYDGKEIYGVIWFDAAAIRAAIGTKTVKQASLRLHMHTGVGRGTAVSVQLYGTDVSYDRTAAPTLATSYGTIGTTNPGEINEITIPAQVINDIVSGTIGALALKSDDADYHKDRAYSKNYARFSGSSTATTENCPRLTVAYQ